MIPQEFTDRMMRLLGQEYPAFAASYKLDRNVGLRLNPLKTEAFPDLSEFRLTPVPWAENGFYYDAATRPGLSAYHEAGLYYMQEPSAMAPAELLDVQPGMYVLDLCAAPGGKSTQIAAKLMGGGLLVSNEIHPQRARILSRNLERCAVKNALVLNEHPARLESRFPQYFDRIMVDAPCSGEGMFRKEEAAAEDWSQSIVEMCADRQLEILSSVANMLRDGGRLVYSTCTFSPEENEGVIHRFLQSHPDFSVKQVLSPHFSQGRPDWVDGDESLRHTFRLWPHKLRGEGHFAAVLEKCGSEAGTVPCIAGIPAPKALQEFCAAVGAELPRGVIFPFGQTLCLCPENMPQMAGLKVLRCGLQLGQEKKGRFEPDHAWALWLKSAGNTLNLSAKGEEILRYLRGETLPCDKKGWCLVQADGLSMGWGKASEGILKNHFPKGLRHL